MSVPQSVQRLSEDSNTSQEVRQLLRASDLDGPSEADLARFAARMAPLVGLPVGSLASASLPRGTAPADISAGSWGGAASPTGLAKVMSSLALKALVATGALTMGLGLWWASQSPVAPVEVVPTQKAPVVQGPSPSLVAPRADTAPIAEEVAVQPAAEPGKFQAIPAAKRASSTAVSRPDELALIAQAQGLRDQPQAALKVLKQHAALYPHGMLAQEREVLAVEALISAGQLEAGRRRASRLEAEYPNSAHLPRIRALLDKADRE